MEAQDATGMRLPDPTKDRRQPIKLCVHGMVVAHRFEETETQGLQKLKEISQPFLTSKPRTHDWGIVGEIVSGKAIVTLD